MVELSFCREKLMPEKITADTGQVLLGKEHNNGPAVKEKLMSYSTISRQR